jgi:hypothetical protein
VPDNTRFFLGFGERLTSRIPPPGGGGGSEPAYSFDEAVARLSPQVAEAAAELAALPEEACPDGQSVGVVTLHPQWMAKSYHPRQLLEAYNLRQVGSRPVAVQPDKWTRSEPPAPAASSELYVAGRRESFERWARDLREAPLRVPQQIRQLEAVRAPAPSEKVRAAPETDAEGGYSQVYEIVLHASEAPRDQFIVSGFVGFAETLGIEADTDRRLYAGGLCFMPVEATLASLDALAQFSFLRVTRPMPRLRNFPGFERSVAAPTLKGSPLPTDGAVDPDLRIAVFDGGFPDSSPLGRWTTAHEPPGVGVHDERLVGHGHDVTSALLFGSLVPGTAAPRPFGVVDHYRVLDKDAENDPYELYEVLRRIDSVLRTKRHQFVNLSIGPALPVEDDQVHTWTAVLDEHLSDGNTMAALAVGNTGMDSGGDARVQVPADCVNGLGVGAADSKRSDWRRAAYSSFGPGRSPGIVKPDVLHFGGDNGQEQFLVYSAEGGPALAETAGTSFASPAALRLAVGVRAHFGGRIGPLALKALLVHAAQDAGHPREEVGWGRLPRDIQEIVECASGTVRVLYQGELSPSQYLRAPIPLPEGSLRGLVTLRATFCYATATDPEDPGAYTRSGLEVTFRPHMARFANPEATLPKTASFFKKTDFDTEQSLRNDAQKWETTLNASRRFQSDSLSAPVFDVHYNARSQGGAARDPERMRYALVVTVEAPRVPDLYDQVARAFAGQLEAMTPVVEVPVRV